MTIGCRLWLAALVASVTLVPHLVAADEPGPLLRQTNYLAVLPDPDRPAEVVLQTQQYSPAYADVLHFTLIGPDSSTVRTGEVPLGEQFRLSFPTAARGLHVLELDSGWNACRVETGTTPSAWVARETVPLQTARGVKQLFFYVPRGTKQFSVWLVAATPREGARVRISGPDGRIAVEEESDYDTPQRIRVPVPPQTDGKVWSLALLKPQTRGLNVDDVKLWLDSTLPPYLALRHDWALLFGQRRHP